MIEFQGVSHMAYGPNGPFPVLNGITLSIAEGESVALVGANGSGKSSLCRCANGLLLPGTGSVRVDGLSTRDPDSCAEIRRRVGMVFQEPSLQLVGWTVAEEIAFGPENLGWSQERTREAVHQALKRWGLEELAQRHPRHLSGGQMAAVALASVLVMEPSYLIIDEPSPLLDTAGMSRFLCALEEIIGSERKGLLWVTQRPEEAARCERVVVICRGEIVADGTADAVLSGPEDLRRWGLEPALATLVSHRLREDGIDLNTTHLETGPLLTELGVFGHGPPSDAVDLRSEVMDSTAPLLVADDADFSYGGGQGVMGLDFEVHAREGVGLAGPSGAGKSTTLYLACGALRPTSGALHRKQRRDGAVGAGLCAQFPEEQFCAATVEREVGMGIMRNGSSVPSRRVIESLEFVGLEPHRIAGRAPHSLSEGEKKRVALATALVSEADLLILDEPTLGLDGAGVEIVVRAVLGHIEAGGAVLIASHFSDFMLRTTSSLVLLNSGRQIGLVRWENELRSGDRPQALPPGQLFDLCSVCGIPTNFRTLASIDSLTDWLAGRLRDLSEARPTGRLRGLSEAPMSRKAASGRENALDTYRKKC